MTLTIGNRDCVLGFDWSVWQTPRSVNDAAAAGHEFMVVKATEGDAYRDPRYGQHVANGVAAGLTVGAYHFARPDWTDGGPYWDGRQEARLFLSAIDDRVRFVVLDLEASVLDAARTTDYVVGFWDEMTGSGRYPLREQRLTYVGFYFNWLHAMGVRDRSCLWVPAYTAGYTRDPDPRRLPLPRWSADLWDEGWCIWQYTSSGTVAGLHPSDVNVGVTSWLDAVRAGEPGDHGRMADEGLDKREEDDMQLWQIDGQDTVYAVGLTAQMGPDAYQEPLSFKGGVYCYAFDTQERFVLSMGTGHPISVLRPGQDDGLIDALRNMPLVYQA